MASLPPLLSLAVVLGVLALSAAAYRYWLLEPVKAQRAARRVVMPFVRITRFPISLVVVTGTFVVFWLMALCWVTLKLASGESPKVAIKLT